MWSVRKHLLVLSIILAGLVFMPLLHANLPPFIRSYHSWVFVWGISLVVFAPKVFIQKTMLFVYLLGVYLWLMLNTVWMEMDPWQNRTFWGDYYAMFLAVSIITYFTYTKNYIDLAILTKFSVIFIGITALMTIIVSIFDPMYSRNIVAFEMEQIFSDSYINRIRGFQRWGAGSRGDGFGFIALPPLLLYYLKSKKRIFLTERWIWLFIIVLMIAIIRMQFATLLIFGFILLFLASIKPKNRKLTFAVLFFLMVLFIIVPSEIFASFFFRISHYFENQEVLKRYFDDIGSYISMGGGEIVGNAVSGRVDVRYTSAWEYFIDNPLFGTYFNQDSTYNSSLGEGHLFLMNKLTVTGLVGFLLWLLPFWFCYKAISRDFKKDFKFVFILVLLGIILYGLIKVIIVRQAWMLFFVIIPGMYYLPLLKKETINNTNKQNE